MCVYIVRENSSFEVYSIEEFFLTEFSMSEVNDYVVGDTGIRYNSSYSTDAAGGDGGSYGGETPAAKAAENWKYHAVEFAKGFAEMSVEFGKGVRDVLKQSVIKEDSILVKKIGPPFVKVCGRFSFLNEYLPEDRDPAYAWSVIFFVLFLASAGKHYDLAMNFKQYTPYLHFYLSCFASRE